MRTGRKRVACMVVLERDVLWGGFIQPSICLFVSRHFDVILSLRSLSNWQLPTRSSYLKHLTVDSLSCRAYCSLALLQNRNWRSLLVLFRLLIEMHDARGLDESVLLNIFNLQDCRLRVRVYIHNDPFASQELLRWIIFTLELTTDLVGTVAVKVVGSCTCSILSELLCRSNCFSAGDTWTLSKPFSDCLMRYSSLRWEIREDSAPFSSSLSTGLCFVGWPIAPIFCGVTKVNELTSRNCCAV